MSGNIELKPDDPLNIAFQEFAEYFRSQIDPGTLDYQVSHQTIDHFFKFFAAGVAYAMADSETVKQSEGYNKAIKASFDG